MSNPSIPSVSVTYAHSGTARKRRFFPAKIVDTHSIIKQSPAYYAGNHKIPYQIL